MPLAHRDNNSWHTHRELLGLLMASLACVVILTISLVDRPALSVVGFGAQHILLTVLIAGITGAAVALVLILTARARKVMRQARAEAAHLKRGLMTAEAIFKAEPQVLMFWEHGDGLRVVTHTLDSVAGLPHEDAGCSRLRAGSMLPPRRSCNWRSTGCSPKAEPSTRFSKPASVAMSRLMAGRPARAPCCASRDVAGTKRDIVRILDQNRKLSRSLRNDRALLDSLPMAAWMCDNDGRIEWVNPAYVRAVEASDAAEVYERQIELLEMRQRVHLKAHAAKGETFNHRMHLVIDGDRKAHDVIGIQTEEMTAAIAMDVADLEQAQGELDRQVSASTGRWIRSPRRLRFSARING